MSFFCFKEASLFWNVCRTFIIIVVLTGNTGMRNNTVLFIFTVYCNQENRILYWLTGFQFTENNSFCFVLLPVFLHMRTILLPFTFPWKFSLLENSSWCRRKNTSTFSHICGHSYFRYVAWKVLYHWTPCRFPAH